MFILDMIARWFGFGSLPQAILSLVVDLSKSLFGISNQSVYGFLSFFQQNFVIHMVFVFYGIGAVVLLIQSQGMGIKHLVGAFSGEMESPASLYVRLMKTLFLAIFYPLVIVKIMLLISDFGMQVIPSSIAVQHSVLYTFFGSLNQNVTSSQVAKSVLTDAGNLAGTVALVGVILDNPMVIIIISIVFIVLIVKFLIHLAFEFLTFVIYTMISPLVICWDFGGFGYFQELLGRQSATIFTQLLRFWIFGLAIKIPATTPMALLWIGLLFWLATSVHKLLSFSGMVREYDGKQAIQGGARTALGLAKMVI
ncbi:hypothetical protein LLE49_19800 [Alicyclobacillus tolerans]|uniref:hypothetical protein n=1 Tax=Alicyclobacillus tolerans TaxID=90970 RepID=UPI001F18C305|nr:hypothetical protein [Alicyclobacillus tolerans]MCF8566968.1 hypothetical protein [Alicyclobacillus tolerans]